MKRVVIRPRIQIAVLLAVFIIFGLLGVGYLTNEEVLAGRYTFGAVLGVVCSLGSVVGVWRALRMGVVIDSEGVHVHSFDSRTVVTPWSEVEDIFCDQVDERAGLPVHGPVLRLGGALMPLRTLGSYSLAGAQARVDQLRGLMPPTRTPVLGA